MSRSPHDRIRMKALTAIVGLSKSEIHRRVHARRFPAQVKESPKLAYWLWGDVELWLRLGEDAWSLL